MNEHSRPSMGHLLTHGGMRESRVGDRHAEAWAASLESARYNSLILRDKLVDITDYRVPQGTPADRIEGYFENNPNIQIVVVTIIMGADARTKFHWVADMSMGGMMQRHLLREVSKQPFSTSNDPLGAVEYIAAGVYLSELFGGREAAIYRTPGVLTADARVRAVGPSSLEELMPEDAFEIDLLLKDEPTKDDFVSLAGSAQQAVDVVVELQHILGRVPLPYRRRAAS